MNFENSTTSGQAVVLTETAPPFSVTVIYEDVSAGRYAKRVLDFLKRELAGKRAVRSSLWRLDILGSQRIDPDVKDNLRSSDLIVVSVSNSEGPPREIVSNLLETVAGVDPLPEILMLDPTDRILCDFSQEPLPREETHQANDLEWRFQKCS